jgi:O-antigen ligase
MKTVEEENPSRSFLALVIGACVLLVVPYATGLANYWSQTNVGLLAPRNILAASGMMAGAAAIMARPRLPTSLWLLLALMAVRLVDAFVRGHGDYEFNPTARSMAALLFCSVLCALTGNTKSFRLGAIASATVVLIANAALNYWEWSNPGYFSTVEGRSAGLLGNANVAAYSISLLLGAILATGVPRAFAYGLITIAAIGIFFTLSRGGAISWILVVGVYILITFEARARSLALAFVLLAASSSVIFYLISSMGLSATSADVRSRFDLFSGRIESLDINDSSRVDLFWEGVEGIKKEPIVGYGTFGGSGFIFRPHNEFLGVWLDNGIIGIALFVSAIFFLGLECYRARQRVLFVGYIGLLSTIPFSHNLLEDYSFLPAWVICAVCAMAAGKMRPGRPTSMNRQTAVP